MNGTLYSKDECRVMYTVLAQAAKARARTQTQSHTKTDNRMSSLSLFNLGQMSLHQGGIVNDVLYTRDECRVMYTVLTQAARARAQAHASAQTNMTIAEGNVVAHSKRNLSSWLASFGDQDAHSSQAMANESRGSRPFQSNDNLTWTERSTQYGHRGTAASV